MKQGEKAGLILGVAIIAGGAVVTYGLNGGHADTVVAATSTTIATTTISTEPVPSSTTATTTLSTTSTVAPTTTVDALAVARGYMALMSSMDTAGFEAATAASSGPASWYATYLGHIDLGADDWAFNESGDAFEMCLDGGDTCVVYDDFAVDDEGRLMSFTVDGVPLDHRLWDPEMIAGVFCAAEVDCEPTTPTPGDGSLWFVLRDAFITPYGALEVVFEIDTGNHPLRLVSRDGVTIEASAFNAAGEDLEFDFCYIGLSDPAGLDWGGGRTGPQLPAGVRTHLACDFYDVVAPVDDTAFTMEFTIEWSGTESPLIAQLPKLAQ